MSPRDVPPRSMATLPSETMPAGRPFSSSTGNRRTECVRIASMACSMLSPRESVSGSRLHTSPVGGGFPPKAVCARRVSMRSEAAVSGQS